MSENLWALQQSNELLLTQVSLLSQRVFELQKLFGGGNSGNTASTTGTEVPALVVTMLRSPLSSSEKTIEEIPSGRDANQNDLQKGKLIDRSQTDLRIDLEDSENQPLIGPAPTDNSRVRAYHHAN